MFRKKKKMMGKGVEKRTNVKHILDMLNYTPIEYGKTLEYAKIMNNPEAYLEKYIKGLALDDQSARLLQVDNLIDTITLMEMNSKEEQFINHMDVIHHLKYVFQGEITYVERYREYLLEDIKKYGNELNDVIEMQNQSDLII